MWSVKYLLVATAVTLLALFVPPLLAATPVGILIAKVVIALAIVGFAVTAVIYFMHESAVALTLRDEDFHWH